MVHKLITPTVTLSNKFFFFFEEDIIIPLVFASSSMWPIREIISSLSQRESTSTISWMIILCSKSKTKDSLWKWNKDYSIVDMMKLMTLQTKHLLCLSWSHSPNIGRYTFFPLII